jgi:hypothetical protein
LSDLGRQQELKAFPPTAEKSERPESSAAVEKRGLLRSIEFEGANVRGELAVQESLGVAARRHHQGPTGEECLSALEKELIRR